jgi:hypothetical protein
MKLIIKFEKKKKKKKHLLSPAQPTSSLTISTNQG